MSRLLNAVSSLGSMFVFCSALQAASVTYTFTFNATSISAATVFSASFPTLLPTTFQSFLSTQLKIASLPAPGAVPGSLISTVALNDGQPGMVAEFVRPGSSGGIWKFTADYKPLTALGTYTFQPGAVVARGLRGSPPVESTDPFTGSITIANVPAASTPEPAPYLLSGVGLLFFGFFLYRSRRLA